MTKTNLAQPRTDVSKLDLGRPSPSAHEVSSADKGAPNLRREITPDAICILTFDRPNSAANIFDRATLAEVNAHLEYVGSHPELKGLVLLSAKKSIFIAGADLNALAAETNPETMRALIEFGQTVFNRLATLRIPTVAAIHGACVGGGCEIALACDWRIASDQHATRIGLPETQIGLIPAWGGSTRLPRLIGLPKALEIILAGKTLPGKPALKTGLVDALVPREYLLPTALKKIREGKPHRPTHRLTNNSLVAAIITPRIRTQLQKKTRGHYPAVFQALNTVTKSVSRSIEDSLRLEVEAILALGQSETTRNLIRLFFLQERAKKLKATPSPASGADKGESAIKRAAVIGAGVMGSGIAQWLSAKGIPVILRDINPEQVARGMANISKLYAEDAKRHTFTKVEARAGMDRVYPATGEVPLHNVDLVIEAAVEDLALKKVVFQKLAAASGEHTVLATNTSALPISEIAAALPRPDQIVGIHFFNPVHRMQLVEVVRTRQSSPAALQRAIQFVQQIGKLPVLVNDSPGFLVNRILIPYLIEAGLLFDAGAGVRDLDEAMLDFGMPMGPMRLLDEVGLDVANHICGTLAQKFPGRLRVPVVVNQMVKAGFFGRKAGRGFYVHSKDNTKTELNTEADKFRVNNAAASLSREQLQERMVLLMINEAARCLEEQVVSSPEDVDFGMVMGTGFAPFRGGPLRYADSIGAPKLVAAMERWSAAGLNYFEPCASLKIMATQNKTFYHDTKATL